MEKLTGKRQYRKREVVGVVEADGQAGSDIANEPGDGQASEAGAAAQADTGRSSKKCSWLGLIDAILDDPEQVSRCWHPEPKAPLVQAKNGSCIEVLVGDPAYQKTTGEIVAM